MGCPVVKSQDKWMHHSPHSTQISISSSSGFLCTFQFYLGTKHNHHRVIGHPPRSRLGLEEGEVVEGGGSLLDEDPPPGQLGLELSDPLDLKLPHLGRMVQSVRVKIQRRVRARREGGSLQQTSLLI